MISIVDDGKPQPSTVTPASDRTFYIADDALWEYANGAWAKISPQEHPWWKRAWMRLRLPGFERLG